MTLWTVWPLMSMPRMSVARAVRLLDGVGELDAAGLAAAADLHLGLDDHPAAQPLGDRARLLRGLRDAAAQHRQPVPGEQLAPLVLVQVHHYLFARGFVAWRRKPSDRPRADPGTLARSLTSASHPPSATGRAVCPSPQRVTGRQALPIDTKIARSPA